MHQSSYNCMCFVIYSSFYSCSSQLIFQQYFNIIKFFRCYIQFFYFIFYSAYKLIMFNVFLNLVTKYNRFSEQMSSKCISQQCPQRCCNRYRECLRPDTFDPYQNICHHYYDNDEKTVKLQMYLIPVIAVATCILVSIVVAIICQCLRKRRLLKQRKKQLENERRIMRERIRRGDDGVTTAAYTNYTMSTANQNINNININRNYNINSEIMETGGVPTIDINQVVIYQAISTQRYLAFQPQREASSASLNPNANANIELELASRNSETQPNHELPIQSNESQSSQLPAVAQIPITANIQIQNGHEGQNPIQTE